jgi:hypothetical protein
VSRTFLLPSGKYVTRFWNHGSFGWQIPTTGIAEGVTLSSADVRELARLERAADDVAGLDPDTVGGVEDE